MRILLLSIGTRGDMEPFLAAGVILAERGHEIHCAMPAQFRELVLSTGLNFHSLDRRFMELLETEAGRGVMGQRGSRFRRIGNVFSLARQSMRMQRKLLEEQRQYIREIAPDRILYHPKCIYARVWAMQHPERAHIISPIPCWLHPTREYPHIAVPRSLGPYFNLLSYRVINRITALVTARFTRRFKEDFPEVSLTLPDILRFMRKREETLYTVSPQLFPRPPEWPEQARVIGYLEREKTRQWSPPQELLDFIEANQKKSASLVFLTFGSMVNADPEAKTRAILRVLAQRGIPAIINTSSGGLLELPDAPEHVHFVRDIPYDWIFPRVQAVVHHGGSGTTHTALKHGCAGLVIPHIIDQFFWNRRVAELGAGPLGISVSKLTAATFAPLLRELIDNPGYRQRAEEIGARMRDERGEEALVALVEGP